LGLQSADPFADADPANVLPQDVREHYVYFHQRGKVVYDDDYNWKEACDIVMSEFVKD